MTSSLRKIKMPNAGMFDADNSLNKAGHHYLEQLQQVPLAVADLQDQITAVAGDSGTIGALAGLNTLDRGHLATGFGSIIIADTEIASSTAAQTCGTSIPFDDTIPQSTEGDQILTGTYTPVSATSWLRVHVDVQVAGPAANVMVAVALFKDVATDAIAARYGGGTLSLSYPIAFDYWLQTGATGLVTFAARAGGVGNNPVYFNAPTGGTRIFGGSVRSFIRITEYEAH